MSEAILFDRHEVERLASLDDRPSRLRGDKLLWVDIDRSDPEDVVRVADAFGLEQVTRELLTDSTDTACFNDHGHYIHVTTCTPKGEEAELTSLECVVGDNWVITAHDDPIEVLDDFAARVSGSGNTGSLDGPAFLATLLEWMLASYTFSFEQIEQRLESFDVDAMRGDSDNEDHIERLVAMRRRVGKLRRSLAAHRYMLVALTHPELKALGDAHSGERYRELLAQFDTTVQESRDAREAIVGSFDVLIARSGHRTNEIMKVLTLASVILLPGALLAGVMGMNFKVGLFENPGLFWVVVAVIIAVAPLTVGMAKLRNWI